MLVYIALKPNQYILLHTLFLLILVFIKHFLALLLYDELLSLQYMFLWSWWAKRSRGLETTICCAHMNWQHPYVVCAQDGVGPSLTNQSQFSSQRKHKSHQMPILNILSTRIFIQCLPVQHKAGELQQFLISVAYSKSWLCSGLPASHISTLDKASPHLEYVLTSIIRTTKPKKLDCMPL